MRLLHTSDWHLGKRFYGRSLVSDQEYVLDQMINLVRDLNPDVMVVAGDIFHQRRPDEEALALFHDTLNRLLNLGTILIFLGGPTDDFKQLHLEARWVRNAGVYMFEDATQVLSPLSFRGARDNFDVSVWCLPYPKGSQSAPGSTHPAILGHELVEKVVRRLEPNNVNILLGYAWAQGAGRRAEMGRLVDSGGQPLQKRLLDFFDVSAFGGSHEPVILGTQTSRYSGSLLCDDPDAAIPARSVTLYDIESKTKIFVDQYPLKPRRSVRVLKGSWEELMAQGRHLRSDDLIVVRSDELDLTPGQRADLRILGPNVVSVEVPSPLEMSKSDPESTLSPLLDSFLQFYKDMSGTELSAEGLAILEDLEKEL